MSKLCRKGLLVIIVILRHSNLHMPEICGKNMPHICGICSVYAAYMRRIFCQIPHIFSHILPQKVPHISRKFSAINRHP